MARLFTRRVVLRRLHTTIPIVSYDPPLREDWSLRGPMLEDPSARASRLEDRRICLLQVSKDLPDPVDWSPADVSLLWRMELNYFHWMPADCPWPRARPWVLDWLEGAPRDLSTPCWNPYAVAQRVLRWTRLIRGPWWDDLQDDPLLPRLLRATYAQCRFLARHQEKELLGNHLLKTACALYAAGRFFAGAETDRWLRQAQAILAREVNDQVLPDGGHYERSPMYHLLVLVDLLDAYNITPPDDPFEDVLRPPIEAMSRLATACTHADGEIPLFNDSLLGQAPSRLEVLRYTRRICPIREAPEPTGFVALPDFGLFRLGDRRSGFWLDAGETGPAFLQAHAHADTGTFELSVGATRMICDRGVYSYQDAAQRAWDRSTPAHSTVAVNGQSSSDCWGSFRVARRARIRALNWDSGEPQSVTLRHDGFRHLPGSPLHERRVTFRDGTYTISDRMIGRDSRCLRFDAFVYLGPGTTVDDSGRDSSGAWTFAVGHQDDPGVQLEIIVAMPGLTEASVFLEPAAFSPTFHTLLPGHRIRAACRAAAEALRIDWRIRVS